MKSMFAPKRPYASALGPRLRVLVWAPLVLLGVAWSDHQVRAQEALFCGVPLKRPLQSGGTGAYALLVSNDPTPLAVVDVTDASGTIGALLLRQLRDPFPPIESCSGSMKAELFPYQFTVSDCIGSDAGDYTIVANVVSQNSSNCGVPLRCGAASQQTLEISGEVDAYTFAGVEGQSIVVSGADLNGTVGPVRLRVFNPDGQLVRNTDSCEGSVTVPVTQSGTHTILVSACGGVQTGEYAIRWQPEQGCPPVGAKDELAYVVNAGSGTVTVIETETNQVAGLVPIAHLSNPEQFGGRIEVNPNQGFAYVTFPGSTSIAIVNTTINRRVGEIAVPVNIESNFGFTIHPSGRLLYAPIAADIVRGVSVFDTATRKLSAVIPIDEQLGEDAGIGVSPDGTVLYLAHGQGRVAVIDTLGNRLVTEIIDSRLAEPINLVFSPDGRFAYAINFRRGIAVIDAKAHQVIATIPVSSDIGAAVFAPDGQRAYVLGDVSSPRGLVVGVVVIDTATHTVARSFAVPQFSDGVGGIAITSNGALLYVTNSEAEFTDRSDELEPGVAAVDPLTGAVVALIPPFGDFPTAISIARAPSGLCTGDDRGETKVTIGELVPSVGFALFGCPNDPEASSGGSP